MILGVTSDATLDEIRAAYHRRARETHPDMNPGTGSAEAFREVSLAYVALRDAEFERTQRDAAPPMAETSSVDDFRARCQEAVTRVRRAARGRRT